MGMINFVTSWLQRLSKSNRPLGFLHIHKTAGTSMNEFLFNRFPAGELLQIYPVRGENWRVKLPKKVYRCYAGHLRYASMLDALPRGLRIFSILREPTQRAISAYYCYRRQTPQELLRKDRYLMQIHEMSFAEFIRANPWESQRIFGSLQTNLFVRMVEKFDDQGRFIPLTRREFDKARDNLSRCLIGVTERFSDFLRILSVEQGWPVPDRAPEANRTPQKPKTVEFDRETRAWLDEHTAFDVELHRFATELFQERWDRWERKGFLVPTPTSEYNPYELTFDQPIPGYGWYPREQLGSGFICFAEPRAWLECPVSAQRGLRIEIQTIPTFPPEHTSPLSLLVNGQEVPLVPTVTPGKIHYEATFSGGTAKMKTRLELRVEKPVRPRDVLPGSVDPRILGPAVTAVRLTPL